MDSDRTAVEHALRRTALKTQTTGRESVAPIRAPMQSISNGSQYKAVRGDAVLVIANILLISPCLKGRRFVFAASPSSCIERTPFVGFFLIFFEDKPLEKSRDCRPAAPAGGDQIKQSRATFHNPSFGESSSPARAEL